MVQKQASENMASTWTNHLLNYTFKGKLKNILVFIYKIKLKFWSGGCFEKFEERLKEDFYYKKCVKMYLRNFF